jgi:hypothetical protein
MKQAGGIPFAQVCDPASCAGQAATMLNSNTEARFKQLFQNSLNRN